MAIDAQALVADMESPLEIYPTPPKVRRDSDGRSAAARLMAQGMRDLPCEGTGPAKKPSKPKTVKVCMPKPVGKATTAKPTSDSECDICSSASHSESSSADDAEGEAEPGIAAPSSHAAPAGVAAKGDRQVWEDGRWWAELHPAGVFQGISLTCNSCAFSKNLNYVHSGMLRDDAKGRLLRWEAACPGPLCKEEHKRIGGRLLRDFA